MSNTNNAAVVSPSIADYAASYVRQFGMAIVPLPPRTKRPLAENWGNEVITDPDQARAYYEAHPDWNMGAALGPSKLCSFDVDDIDATRLIFEEFGWDLDALMQYPTIQGSPGGFRVMFRVPDGIDLQYHALTWPKQDGSRGRFTVWEIRAADTQQRQDVLPPSIHPDTQEPYVWLTKPKANEGLPTPPDFLLQMWKHWDALKPQFQAVCPWSDAHRPQTQARKPAAQPRGDSVIDAYNTANGIEDHLARYGYRKQGKRWLSPHSTTGLPGVTVWAEANKCFIHHASDPLCSDESGQPVGPFDLFAYYDHGGDMKKAAKAAAEQLGMKPQPPMMRTPQAMVQQPNIDPETGEILDGQSAPAAANDNLDPIDIFAEFPVPPIKREMLPDTIADYAFDQGELVGVEPAMIAIPSLVACAAALHDGIQLQVKRHEKGWRESARLWCALVGNPSIKKSPSIGKAISRVRKINADLAEENKRTLAKHAADMESYKDAKKEAKKTGEVVTAPEQPMLHRLVVQDTTVEALSEVLKDNPRGILCLQDELSGWFGSMDAYSGGKAGGKDRAHWLEAYQGGGRTVDRVMRGTINIPNWSVSMIGGIQPDAIRRIAQNMPDDGLMQRFMIVVGRNAKEYDRHEDTEAHNRFRDLVDHLHSIQPVKDPVTMTEDAHQVREALGQYTDDLMTFGTLPGGLVSHLGKWPGLFARLTLLFHAIECHRMSVHPGSVQVSGDTARRVDLLMRKFLLPHALAYYTDILGAASELEHARGIAAYILAKTMNVITKRDLMQNYKPWRGLDDWKRQKIMQVLEDMGWLVPMDDARESRKGAHTWAVVSSVHVKFADKAAHEAEKRARIREEIQAMKSAE